MQKTAASYRHVLFFLLSCSPVLADGTPLVLVDEGRPAATIVLARQPSRAAQLAASELRNHVRKITGALLPIASDAAEVPGTKILVGASRAVERLSLRAEQFLPEEYLIRATADTLVLLGRDEPAAAQGPQWAAGRFGQALAFDGIDDGLWLPESGFDDERGTLEAWIWMPAAAQSGEATLLRLDSQRPWTYHIVRRVTNKSCVSYTVYDGKQGRGVTSRPLNEGWHHVAATHDAGRGQIELFVDGQSQGTASYVKTACRNAPLHIGGLVQMQVGSNRVGNPFCGRIDEVRVSRVVRTFSPSTLSAPCTPDAATGLLLHLDEGTGAPQDATGNETLTDIPGLFEAKATLWAVYDFLERYADVRWYGPGEICTVCPRHATLTVPRGEVRRRPAMSFRTVASSQLFLATPDEPISMKDYTLWRLRMRLGGQPFAANHSFYGYYDRFLKEHPDWFAQGYKGRPPQLCYSNPEVVAQVVRDARDYFSGQPAKPGAQALGDYFGLVPMDNGRWCKCARCQAQLDASEADNLQFSNGKASGYVWGFVNRVAREFSQSHPDKYFTALAYATYAYYPKQMRLEPNVAVQLCLHTRNWWCPSMEQNDRKILQQWVGHEGARRPIYLWLYYCFPGLSGRTGHYPLFPGFFAHQVVRQMELYHQAGVKGIFMEHHGETGHSYLHDQVEMYVTWRLADDPTLDGRRLIDEFFTRYYGSAAEPMRQLYAAIEATYCNPASYPERIQTSPAHQHQTEELAWKYLGTPQRMARFAALMAAAQRSAPGGVEARRVALFETGIWKPMLAGAAQWAKKQTPKQP